MSLAIVAIAIATAAGCVFFRIASDASAAAARFELHTGAQATILYDTNDRPVFTLYAEQRVDVPLDRMSPHLVAAVLAAEDRRFRRHHGYDLGRLAASGIANLRARGIVQGGSTITQQLVRMTNGDRDRTVSRKLREILTAAAVERRFSKDAILETYLNKIYLGEGFYGVEAAARGYYGKPASDVSPDEAATLAALIQSPARYTQQDRADHVRARRNWILAAMQRDRQIDDAEYRAAAAAPLRVSTSAARAADSDAANACSDTRARDTMSAAAAAAEQRDCAAGTGLYFKEAVRRELMARLPSSQVLSAGLRVYTTIDPAMQAAAERSLIERLTAIERATAAANSKRSRAGAGAASQAGATTVASGASATNASNKLNASNGPSATSATGTAAAAAIAASRLQGSLVAIDPTTGYVKVLVGGRNFAESPFDRARQARRQPGSAFKPFVYASAIENGYAPGTILHDLDQPVEALEGAYLPSGEHEEREMTVRRALVVSSNRAAVHMLQLVGASSVLTYAQRFGITSPLPAVPSLALGTGEVTLLELTSAYGVFANKGEHVEPTLIRRVESAQGEVLYRAKPETRHVVTEDTAYLVTSMLADVIQRGTGTAVRRLGFTAPAAGKTGTTDRVADAWFVGYTPHLTAGVWIGYDDPRAIRKGAFASTIAVPVWATFLKAATAGQPADEFAQPSDIDRVAYCPLSGQPAGPFCQLAQDSHARMTIVVSTDATTGTPTATAVPAQGEPTAPQIYYDLARTADAPPRCAAHADWGPSDGSAPPPSYQTTSGGSGGGSEGATEGVSAARVRAASTSSGVSMSGGAASGATAGAASSAAVAAPVSGVATMGATSIKSMMMSPADAANVLRHP